MNHPITTKALREHVRFDEQPVFQCLLDTPDLRLMMITMCAGQVVDWHRANVQISVFVDEGEIDFGTREDVSEKIHRLSPSTFITLPPNVDHNLIAHADSIILVYKTPNPNPPLTLEEAVV